MVKLQTNNTKTGKDLKFLQESRVLPKNNLFLLATGYGVPKMVKILALNLPAIDLLIHLIQFFQSFIRFLSIENKFTRT